MYLVNVTSAYIAMTYYSKCQCYGNLPDGRHCSMMSSLLFVFRFNSGLCSGGGGGGVVNLILDYVWWWGGGWRE